MARFCGRMRVMSRPSSTIRPASGMRNPEITSNKRGLARAVRADDAEDLALVQLDRHVVDRGDPGEALRDAPCLEHDPAFDHRHVSGRDRVGRAASVRRDHRRVRREGVEGGGGGLDPFELGLGLRLLLAGGDGRALEEDRAEQVGSLEQLGGEPVEPDRALLHEERLVGGGERHVHRLLDEDHGDALLAELLHDVEELLDDEGRQAEGQLVDHQQLGLGEERHGQREHLLLATRELRRGVVEPAAQRGEQVERVVGRGLGVLVVASVDPQRDLEVLGDAERREHAPPAGNLDDALAGDQVRPHAADVDARVADGAAFGRDEAGDRAQHGGLAGAVGAEQRDRLALAQLEVHAEEHLHLAVCDVDRPEAEQVGLASAQGEVGVREVVDRRNRAMGQVVHPLRATIGARRVGGADRDRAASPCAR